MSETISLVLTRIMILNEIFANTHYAGLPLRWSYFKSRKGDPIDLVWDQIPIKIVGTLQQIGWEERAVHGAMKALGADRGLIVAPTDHVTLLKKEKIGRVPWTFWS